MEASRHVLGLVLLLWGACGCGQSTPRDLTPGEDADLPDAPVIRDASPDPDTEDGAPDVGLPDAAGDGDVIVDDADVRSDGGEADTDTPVTELSCLSGAACAMCCRSDDLACQMSCVAEAPPSTRVQMAALVACIGASGCSASGGTPDFPCLLDRCRTEVAACGGGAGGTAGCVATVWCLVSSGCTGLATCPEQGLCYQECLGAARPEVIDVAQEVLACVGESCLLECAAGLSSSECLACLGRSCGSALRGCLGG